MVMFDFDALDTLDMFDFDALDALDEIQAPITDDISGDMNGDVKALGNSITDPSTPSTAIGAQFSSMSFRTSMGDEICSDDEASPSHEVDKLACTRCFTVESICVEHASEDGVKRTELQSSSGYQSADSDSSSDFTSPKTQAPRPSRRKAHEVSTHIELPEALKEGQLQKQDLFDVFMFCDGRNIRFNGLGVPKGCTVGDWKRLLSSGELLGEKVLYAGKLTCRVVEGEQTGPQLGDCELLPVRPKLGVVRGPGSVETGLRIALTKKVGVPDTVKSSLKDAKSAAPLPLVASGRSHQLQFHGRALKGHREYMEDRFVASIKLPEFERASLFGIFDGHGGADVADLVARHLPTIVAKELAEGKGAETALVNAFEIVDTGLRAADSAKFGLQGSTATVVLLLREDDGKQQLFCANCGDSRTIVCRGGVAVGMSRDHTVTDETEQARIIAGGGKVNQRGRILLKGAEGGLNISRAFGDFAYKARADLPADQQWVIATPEIRTVEVDDNIEFVALASDGVFDMMDSDQVVQGLRRALTGEVGAKQMQDAVDEILERALHSGDNVSLCLVRFR